jgi:two-component system NtrC family sensor kinase
MSSPPPIRALVVDIDRDSAHKLAGSLRKHHPEIDLRPIGTVAAAFEVLRSGAESGASWDAIVLTVGGRHPEGLELMRRLYESAQRLPVILIGDATDIEAAVEGMKIGASDFLARGTQMARHLGPRLRQAIDRRRARQRHEQLLPVVDALPDTVLLCDSGGKVLCCSQACGPMFGAAEEDLAGAPFERLLDLDLDQSLPDDVRALRPGGSLEREARARRIDGSTFHALLTAVRVRSGEPLLLLIVRDVSRWKLLQENGLQREKLTSLGQLISGVAHELNNPLTGVLGFSQLMLGYADLPDRARGDLRTVIAQAQRCERIVRNLLSFAREHKPEKRPIGVNGVLESTLALLEYPLRSDNILVVKDLQEDLPLVTADFHQLQQIFLSLLTNAHHAMARTRRGNRIVLRTRAQEGWVRIEVIDDGPGIPEADLPRIFDPFFTTKPRGSGAGLGLSMCYGMVSEHGGRIRVSSHEGKGTAFTVELPAPLAEAASETPAEAGETGADGRPRILVADDEDSILDLLFRALTAEGYRVDTARSGEVALRKIDRGGHDLLITDLRIPGCDGLRLLEHWRTRHPERAESVLLTTGDTASEQTQELLERSPRSCIQKPFDLTELTQRVRSLLEGPAGADPRPPAPQAEGGACPAGAGAASPQPGESR